MRRRFGERTLRTRLVAAAMVSVAIATFHSAGAAPADVFSIAAPVVGADPPKATDIGACSARHQYVGS